MLQTSVVASSYLISSIMCLLCNDTHSVEAFQLLPPPHIGYINRILASLVIWSLVINKLGLTHLHAYTCSL